MEGPFVKERTSLEALRRVDLSVQRMGEVNDDISALNPNGWDYISHSVHLGFGKEERRG